MVFHEEYECSPPPFFSIDKVVVAVSLHARRGGMVGNDFSSPSIQARRVWGQACKEEEQ